MAPVTAGGMIKPNNAATSVSYKIRNWSKKVGLLEDADRRRILEVPVYALTNGDNSFAPLYFAKVRRALQCLAEHDPRRFKRFRHDVKRIVVSFYEGCHYDQHFRMIVLYWGQIASQTAEEIALILVHEATHARQLRWGVNYSPEVRARAEAGCVAQEISFAKRLPNGAAFAERLSKKLEKPWWTPEALAKRKLRELRDVGVPQWLYGRLEWLMRRRLARFKDRAPDSPGERRIPPRP
jgi:hypothetical protein